MATTAVLFAGCGTDIARAPTFEKLVLDTAFRAEGAAIFDVNRDGHADVVTDQLWYEGPAWVQHEIRSPEVFDPNGYSKSVSAWGEDVDDDGWVDLVVAPFPTDAMYWYRNPQGGDDHWVANLIAPPLAAGTEQPVYVELFGDGQRAIVAGNEPQERLGYYLPDVDPGAPWVFHPVGPPQIGAYRFFHGLGAGDVDGDGRTDILSSAGWFAQTADRDVWTFHAFDFGLNACGTMFALDVDGDRRADVLCPTPHAYGLYWWRQLDDGFERRVIDETISQLGALGVADLDGDGTPELVTGKNWLAHPAGDPGTDDPAIIAYYELRADGVGGVEIERHDIDADSGIGRQVTIGDLDADGRPEIVEATKKGVFAFLQR